jgi:hypothetical protein
MMPGPGVPRIAGARRAGISSASVHRRAFGLQPWRTENVQISPGPLLASKIRDVAGLYLAPPDGTAVFAVDEKPQIQAYPVPAGAADDARHPSAAAMTVPGTAPSTCSPR